MSRALALMLGAALCTHLGCADVPIDDDSGAAASSFELAAPKAVTEQLSAPLSEGTRDESSNLTQLQQRDGDDKPEPDPWDERRSEGDDKPEPDPWRTLYGGDDKPEPDPWSTSAPGRTNRRLARPLPGGRRAADAASA